MEGLFILSRMVAGLVHHYECSISRAEDGVRVGECPPAGVKNTAEGLHASEESPKSELVLEPHKCLILTSPWGLWNSCNFLEPKFPILSEGADSTCVQGLSVPVW